MPYIFNERPRRYRMSHQLVATTRPAYWRGGIFETLRAPELRVVRKISKSASGENEGASLPGGGNLCMATLTSFRRIVRDATQEYKEIEAWRAFWRFGSASAAIAVVLTAARAAAMSYGEGKPARSEISPVR